MKDPYWIFKVGFIIAFLLFIPAIILEKPELFSKNLQPDMYVINSWKYENKTYKIWCIDGYKYLESENMTQMFEVIGNDKVFPERCKNRYVR